VYSEESDYGYFMGRRKLHFKAQTRLWGYSLGKQGQEDERTSLIVESEKVQDPVTVDENVSPVLAQRSWERQAEDNVMRRVQKAGLMAPEGEVNKVLETV